MGTHPFEVLLAACLLLVAQGGIASAAKGDADDAKQLGSARRLLNGAALGDMEAYAMQHRLLMPSSQRSLLQDQAKPSADGASSDTTIAYDDDPTHGGPNNPKRKPKPRPGPGTPPWGPKPGPVKPSPVKPGPVKPGPVKPYPGWPPKEPPIYTCQCYCCPCNPCKDEPKLDASSG